MPLLLITVALCTVCGSSQGWRRRRARLARALLLKVPADRLLASLHRLGLLLLQLVPGTSRPKPAHCSSPGLRPLRPGHLRPCPQLGRAALARGVDQLREQALGVPEQLRRRRVLGHLRQVVGEA